MVKGVRMKKLILLVVGTAFSIGAMSMETYDEKATQKLFTILYEKPDTDYAALAEVLRQNPDVNGLYNNRTPLETAALLGKVIMFNQLVRKNAKVTDSCLCYAVIGKTGAMIELLLKDNNITVNAKINNYSALHYAVRAQDKDTVITLLRAGAQVSFADYGWGSEIDNCLKEYASKNLSKK